MNVLPTFQSEDEEREFWSTHDSSDYVDWVQAEPTVFPNLKPSTKTISLRMSESMLDEIRQLANRRDVPDQSLIKMSSRSASTPSFAVSRCEVIWSLRSR